MDLWEAVVVAFRRWYVTLPVLIIGLFVALQLAESVDPVHEANATVQYLPPVIDTGDEARLLEAATNPYSDLRSLAFATELSAQDESFRAELAAAGLDADFTVSTDRREPVLYITTQSTSAASALGTLDALIQFVEEEAVAKQQARFSDDASLYVTPDLLRKDSTTAVDLTSRTRARVLLLAVAGVVAMAAAVLAEFIIGQIRGSGRGPDETGTDPGVVWFGVPMQGSPGQGPHAPPGLGTPPPHLSPAPEYPERATGTTGDEGASDEPPLRRASRWSR